MASTQATSHCTVCNRAPSKMCASCHSAAYCSQTCQEHDWATHKVLCKAFKNRGDRPSRDFHLSILFPATQKEPRLEYVAEEYPYIDPELLHNDSEAVNQYVSAERCILYLNPRRKFGLDHTLYIICRENFMNDGSVLNQSIRYLTSGGAGYPWCGNVLVTRRRGINTESYNTDDITLADLRHVLDFFHRYDMENDMFGELTTRDVSPMTKAIKVACDGDQKLLGAEPFEDVNLPSDHLALKSDAASSISRRVGFPLAFFKLPAKREVKAMCGGCCMPGITYAMRDIEPASSRWGFAPLHWTGGYVTTCLAVREDRKHFTARQLEAFFHFCQTTLEQVFEDAHGDGYPRRSRESVLEYLNPHTFNVFFEGYRKDKIEEMTATVDDKLNEWLAVQCPTEV